MADLQAECYQDCIDGEEGEFFFDDSAPTRPGSPSGGLSAGNNSFPSLSS